MRVGGAERILIRFVSAAPSELVSTRLTLARRRACHSLGQLMSCKQVPASACSQHTD